MALTRSLFPCRVRKFAPAAAILLAGTFYSGVALAAEPVQSSEAGGAAPAREAASASMSDDTIIVTARRRQENLQDVPMTVLGISQEALQAKGIVDPKDLGQAVPGLMWKGGGVINNKIFIRGVGNTSSATGASPAVAMYLDDVYLNTQSFYNFALFDAQRMEVLKGPQGTLYGRNTTGGAVKFVSRKPEVGGDVSGDFYGEVGNYNYYKAEGGVSLPLGDIAAARLSGLIVKRGGVYRDYVNGGRLIDKDMKAVRLQLKIEPTDSFSALLMATYGKNDSDDVRYKRIDYTNAQTLVGECANPSVGSAPGCTNLATAFGFAPPELNTDIYQLQSFARRGQSPVTIEVYGLSANLDYDFGPVTLSSVTSYYHGKTTDYSDVGTSSVNLASQLSTGRPRQFGQEFRLATNGDPRFRWLLGAFYFDEKLFATQMINILPFGIGFGPAYDQRTRSKALFAEGTYRVMPQLDLTVGLRYSHDRKRIDYTYYNFKSAGRDFVSYDEVLTDPIVAATRGVVVNGAVDRTSNVSGRVSLSYKLNPDMMIYASANRGYKAAEFNLGASRQSAAAYVAPERVDQFELGVKSQFLNRAVTFNLAGYYYKYKNKQETVFNTGLALFSNADAKAWGLEAEITVRPFEGLTLASQLALFDGEYTNYDDCGAGGVSCTGNTLPNAPKFAAQFSAEYAFEIGGRKASIQGGADYRTRTRLDPLGKSYLTIPSYWLINARGSVEAFNGVTFSLWAKNIANKRYFYDTFNVSDYGFAEGAPGEPRTFGAAIGVHF